MSNDTEPCYCLDCCTFDGEKCRCKVELAALRQQLATLMAELAEVEADHKQAVKWCERLTKERDEAREALANTMLSFEVSLKGWERDARDALQDKDTLRETRCQARVAVYTAVLSHLTVVADALAPQVEQPRTAGEQP